MKINISIFMFALAFCCFSYSVHANTIPISSTLTLGSQGTEVSILQKFLKDHGFFNYPEITQYFGPITLSSVLEFQKTHGIQPIGVVGPMTRATIAQVSSSELASQNTIQYSNQITEPSTPFNPKQNTQESTSISNPIISNTSQTTPAVVVQQPSVKKSPVSNQQTVKIKSSGGSSRPRADREAPAITLTNPADSSVINSSILLHADATDNKAVEGVQFLINGALLGNEIMRAPYSTEWNIDNLIDGNYTVTATARDKADNRSTSNQISITIDKTAPTITLTSPNHSEIHTPGHTTFTVDATDTIGISDVTYTLVPIGTTTPEFSIIQDESPYTLESPFIAEGIYTLYVTATDRAGNSSTTQAVYTFEESLIENTYEKCTDGIDNDLNLSSDEADENCVGVFLNHSN